MIDFAEGGGLPQIELNENNAAEKDASRPLTLW
jgi:hypothetical protein